MEITKYKNKKFILNEEGGSLIFPIATELNGITLPEFTMETIREYFNEIARIISTIEDVSTLSDLALPPLLFLHPNDKMGFRSKVGNIMYGRILMMTGNTLMQGGISPKGDDSFTLGLYTKPDILTIRTIIYDTREYIKRAESLNYDMEKNLKLTNNYMETSINNFEMFAIRALKSEGLEGVALIPNGVEDFEIK